MKNKGLKSLKSYLSAREKNQSMLPKECQHGKDIWCGNCINFGEYFDFRKEGFGHGHIITNKSI